MNPFGYYQNNENPISRRQQILWNSYYESQMSPFQQGMPDYNIYDQYTGGEQYAPMMAYNGYYSGNKITKESVLAMYGQKPGYMILVYANWCGHCAAIKAQLGDKINKKHPNISFYEDSDVDDSFKDYYPHIYIVTTDSAGNPALKDGTREELNTVIAGLK